MRNINRKNNAVHPKQPVLTNTAGLDILCKHKKPICRETKRAVTDLKLRTKSSR